MKKILNVKRKTPFIASTLYAGMLIFFVYSIYSYITETNQNADNAYLINESKKKINELENEALLLDHEAQKLYNYHKLSLEDILSEVRLLNKNGSKHKHEHKDHGFDQIYLKVYDGFKKLFLLRKESTQQEKLRQLKIELSKHVDNLKKNLHHDPGHIDHHHVDHHSENLYHFIEHLSNKPEYNLKRIILASQKEMEKIQGLSENTYLQDISYSLGPLHETYKKLNQWATNMNQNSEGLTKDESSWNKYTQNYEKNIESTELIKKNLEEKYNDNLEKNRLLHLKMKVKIYIYLGLLLFLFTIVYILQYLLNIDAQARTQESHKLVQLLSHDIANPIAIIISGLELYESKRKSGKDISQRTQAMIQKSIHAAKRIQDMIDSVRFLKSIESGKYKLDEEVVDVSEALDTCIDIFDYKTASKNITMRKSIEVNSDIKLQIKTHKSIFINQILSNLISNAIKFSQKNSFIELIAKQKKNETHILIKDYGIGIPPNILKTIFSDTNQTSRKGTQGEIGTGFGMPLVKKFVDMHHGASISISSIEKTNIASETGTTITLIFKSFNN